MSVKTLTLPAQQYQSVERNIHTSGSSQLYEEADSKSLKDVQEGADVKVIKEKSDPEESLTLVLKRRIEGQERNIVVLAVPEPENKEDKKKKRTAETETQPAS